MIHHVRNPLVLAALLYGNAPDGQVDDTFDAREWLSDPRNIALRIGEDLAMFEHCGPGVYLGHIWFVSRGKVAITRARMLIEDMRKRGAMTIRGEIPAGRKDVQAFMARLGFKSTGDAVRPQGRVNLVQITNLRGVKSVAQEAVPLLP